MSVQLQPYPSPLSLQTGTKAAHQEETVDVAAKRMLLALSDVAMGQFEGLPIISCWLSVPPKPSTAKLTSSTEVDPLRTAC